MAGKTEIVNMSLARLGGRRINDYDDASDKKLEAIYCRLFFEPTAKALMKDHYWPFAKARVQLSQDTTAPPWQYDHAYLLPNDFLRLIVFYNGSEDPTGKTEYTYEIEGNRLLTDEDTCYLRYIRWISDTGAWDPLFTEVFILRLAKKLVIPLSQDVKLKLDIDNDLIPLLRQVRAMDRMDEQVIGRNELRTWREARFSDTA